MNIQPDLGYTKPPETETVTVETINLGRLEAGTVVTEELLSEMITRLPKNGSPHEKLSGCNLKIRASGDTK